jgi:pyruvate,water dikinase
VAEVPRIARPAVRLLLKRAERMIPLRGVVKVGFMQAFDALRALSRRAGVLLAENGTFDGPDDVFYVTRDELLTGVPRDIRDIIPLRREKRAEYLQYRLPEVWTGEPIPTVVGDGSSSSDRPTRLSGLGVSSGVVEGVARVIDDPSFAEVEPDEILVSSTTDPSWASIMFISSALVVDIGGAMSHAAVVARELGIPCVVATGNGTELIRSGDRVRVDGHTGTVEILDRANT